MKKSTLRLSAVVLACVPLLVGGASFVNAEDGQNNTATSVVGEAKATATSSSEAKDTTKDTKEDGSKEETSPVQTKTLKVQPGSISGEVGKTDTIKLAKIKLVDEKTKTEKEVQLKGTFEPELKNEFIAVDKNGNWKALAKAEKKEIQLDFKPDMTDPDTKKVLNAMFPGETFDNKTIKTDKIPVNFVDVDPTKEVASLDLTAKNKGNKLTVNYKETELKATFTPVKNEKLTLAADGTVQVPISNNETKFTQKVNVKLDKEDANFKKLAESKEFSNKEIKTDYDNIEATFTVKVITLTYKTTTLTAKPNEGGKLEFQDVEGVKITGKFTEVKDDEFLSLDADGNWKAKKAGQGGFTPTFNISDTSLAELQKKSPEDIIQVTSGKLSVKFDGEDKKYVPTNKKTYAPVNKLPQTGEEKMKFAGIIGIIVIAIVGIIFFMKKKKKDDEDEEI